MAATRTTRCSYTLRKSPKTSDGSLGLSGQETPNRPDFEGRALKGDVHDTERAQNAWQVFFLQKFHSFIVIRELKSTGLNPYCPQTKRDVDRDLGMGLIQPLIRI
uniref:AsIV-cont00168-ORF1 n=1 Tax=Apophua simplicipes ichnovirus TaxID=1329648 RepID=S5DRF5_9VIRU|nr:AsIV-cont00168-ORF1 [Apophua simplicipes ichnovirus]